VKSADVIVKGLASVKTRGFDPQAPEREAKQQELNAKLRAFKTRQITVEERTDVAKLIDESKYPNVDVQILFAFDSAEILPEARPALDELGKALSDPKLASGTFLIAGHTDAKGSDAYNLGLSQRRAESVKAFLVGTYHVDGNRLSVIGFGEEQLKNKDDPLADENRRVQIVNTGSATVAEGKPAPAPEPAAAPAPDATPPADAAPPGRRSPSSSVDSHARRGGDGEALLDAAEQSVTDRTVGRQDLLAVAARHGGVGRRPIFHVDGEVAGKSERLVMRFRRQRDDQVEGRIVQVVKRGRPMAREIDADLLHGGDGEGVRFARAHAGRVDIDAPAGEMLEDPCRHRRTHGVAAAGEEDRARQVGFSRRQGISPSNGARRSG
jgi:outer membrane protein OmpA-like peptidoglycan-associated protein